MIFINRIIITLLFSFFSLISFAQQKLLPTAKQIRWQHLDLDSDSVYGISMDRAYNDLLKSRKKKTVVVAVIDSGTDTLHADLQPILWLNKKEKGSDEDHNGYLNDRHGWNFLGSKKGNGTVKPGLEYQRVYLSLKNKYGNYTDSEILASGNKEGLMWLSTKERFKVDSTGIISGSLIFWKQLAREDSLLQINLGKEVFTAKDIADFMKSATISKDIKYLPAILNTDSTRTNKQEFRNVEESKINLLKWYSQEPAIHRSETIGDDYNDLNDKFYGNPSVFLKTTDHGTHVASVIGAIRNNGIGIDGIADAVRLMVIRAVPAGQADEYDKDVALAIRYAVDNGAKVINMSFGKPYSPQQTWVQEAIQYAAKNDVLIIHAAGNDASNSDSTTFYPTSRFSHNEHASNMITVGASEATREKLISLFSNYGKYTVDVFAPGGQIYTALEENGLQYMPVSGTSIAAPVVSGLAAVLRSYFPKLSAKDVKSIIESSVTKIDGYVTKPGSGGQQVLMTELCRTGGIVNAYNAIKFAEKITRESNKK